MFNSFMENRYSENYPRQEDHKFDEPAESEEHQEDILHLDQIAHRVASNIGKSAYDSSKINLEFEEEYTLVKNIWDQLQSFTQKAWVREAVIISAVMLFKTGLWIAYRIAKKQGMKIVHL